jgi:predicted transcriptional regulator
MMAKTTLTLSEPVAKTLKVYTARTKSSMRAQSKVVEEALREFFERRNVKIAGS